MKILTVFTGGTIACSSRDGVLSPDESNGFLLLDMYNKTYGGAEFETAVPYSILSENLSAENLGMLYESISGYDLSRFDGVIVCHGTDTLQYTGAFLSLRFGLCETPIVLASANYPLADPRSNGFENFSAAVSFIGSGQGKGVFIAYKNGSDKYTAVHRAIRTLPHLPFSDELFSLKNQPYGYIADGAFVPNPDYSESQSEFPVLGAPTEKSVLFLRPYPGMVYPRLDDGFKAILLDSYHSGTIRTDGAEIEGFCGEAKRLGINVYLTGSEEGFGYESKSRFSCLGIKPLPPMSPIAAYVRLWLE